MEQIISVKNLGKSLRHNRFIFHYQHRASLNNLVKVIIVKEVPLVCACKNYTTALWNNRKLFLLNVIPFDYPQ